MILQEPPIDSKTHRVPFAQFFLTTGIQLTLALGVFWLLAPKEMLAELAQPWNILLWTFLLGIPLSLFEYLYHRYLLHSAILPFLGSMHRAHGLHHSLTSVKAPVLAKEPTMLVTVSSEFPVEHEHQEESMMFPFYALTIFYGIFGVLLGLPLKLLFPGAPVLMSVLLGVTFCYGGYELWHAVTHLPYERFWQPLMNKRGIGNFVRHAYSFHLMHHWRPSCNLAVVGFWGFAVWDHLFRTHRRPKRIPLHGAEVTFTDANLKKPLWPIAMFDRWQTKLYLFSRKVESFFAKLFLPGSTRLPKD